MLQHPSSNAPTKSWDPRELAIWALTGDPRLEPVGNWQSALLARIEHVIRVAADKIR